MWKWKYLVQPQIYSDSIGKNSKKSQGPHRLNLADHSSSIPLPPPPPNLPEAHNHTDLAYASSSLHSSPTSSPNGERRQPWGTSLAMASAAEQQTTSDKKSWANCMGGSLLPGPETIFILFSLLDKGCDMCKVISLFSPAYFSFLPCIPVPFDAVPCSRPWYWVALAYLAGVKLQRNFTSNPRQGQPTSPRWGNHAALTAFCTSQDSHLCTAAMLSVYFTKPFCLSSCFYCPQLTKSEISLDLIKNSLKSCNWIHSRAWSCASHSQFTRPGSEYKPRINMP